MYPTTVAFLIGLVVGMMVTTIIFGVVTYI